MMTLPAARPASLVCLFTVVLLAPAVASAQATDDLTCLGSEPTIIVDDDFALNGPPTFFGKPFVRGTNGDDVILVIASVGVTVQGGDGDDRICGGFRNDRINGQKGDDLIVGYEGNDYVVGGPGNDQLGTVLGRDTLRGNGGSDRLIVSGVSNPVVVYGGVGADTFIAETEASRSTVLNGNQGNDSFELTNGFSGIVRAGKHADRVELDSPVEAVRIFAGEGNDSVVALTAPELVNLGSGNDTFEGAASQAASQGSFAKTQIASGEGFDVINVTSKSVGLVVALDGVRNELTIDADAASPRFKLSQGEDTVRIVSDSSGYNIRGRGGDDTITIVGNGEDHEILGDDGDDTIRVIGNGDRHTLVGSSGDDVVEVVGKGTGHIISP